MLFWPLVITRMASTKCDPTPGVRTTSTKHATRQQPSKHARDHTSYLSLSLLVPQSHDLRARRSPTARVSTRQLQGVSDTCIIFIWWFIDTWPVIVADLPLSPASWLRAYVATRVPNSHVSCVAASRCCGNLSDQTQDAFPSCHGPLGLLFACSSLFQHR